MPRKCGFFVLSLAVLSTSFSVLFSGVSNARAPTGTPPWTGDLPSKLDSALSGSSVSDWRNLNYATVKYDDDSFIFWIAPDDAFVIADNGTGYTGFTGRLCRWDYSLNSPGCNDLSTNYSVGTDLLYSLHFTDNYKLTHPTAAEEYSALLDNSTPTEGTPQNPSSCDSWDVTCWFSSLTGSIVDGFQELANYIGNAFTALGSMIASALVPDDSDGTFTGTMTTYFSDINDSLHAKLGILLFPFDALTSLGSSLMVPINPFGDDISCAGSTGLSYICTSFISFDFQGNNYGIGLGSLEQTMPTLFTWVRYVLQLLLAFAIVWMLRDKYYSIVRS